MINIVLRYHNAWLLLGLILVLQGCGLRHYLAAAGPMYSVDGTVIDVSTGQPLGDAYVIQEYYGAFSQWPHYMGTKDECYGEAVSVTDESGRFTFPALSPNVWSGRSATKYFQYLYVYRAGYSLGEPVTEYWRKNWPHQKVERKNVLALTRDTSPASSRIKYLAELVGTSGRMNFGCDTAVAGFDTQRVAVTHAMYMEATRLAQSEHDYEMVEKLCEFALGYDGIHPIFFPHMFPKPCVFDIHHHEKMKELHKKRVDLLDKKRAAWLDQKVKEIGPYDPRDMRFWYGSP